jgi:hypothetical protein
MVLSDLADASYGSINTPSKANATDRRKRDKRGSFRVDINRCLQWEQLRDGIAMGLQGYNSKLNWLLICVPFGILSGLLHLNDEATFLLNFLGMIPLAMILGKATEDIANHTNETIGALVNVTYVSLVPLPAFARIHALRDVHVHARRLRWFALAERRHEEVPVCSPACTPCEAQAY